MGILWDQLRNPRSTIAAFAVYVLPIVIGLGFYALAEILSALPLGGLWCLPALLWLWLYCKQSAAGQCTITAVLMGVSSIRQVRMCWLSVSVDFLTRPNRAKQPLPEALLLDFLQLVPRRGFPSWLWLLQLTNDLELRYRSINLIRFRWVPQC